MTGFQISALAITAAWLLLVGLRFQRSNPVLVGGLFVLGLYSLAAYLLGWVAPSDFGLGAFSWPHTLAYALPGLVVLVAYSFFADWLASRWIKKAPTLEAFRLLQQSRTKLVAGIVVAWVLGGILEELVFRGIVLRSIDVGLVGAVGGPLAAAVSLVLAALGAGVIHLYQGPRAVVTIIQLSILFGVLFVVSGYDLWAVIVCHGLYDTIAFIRFARKKSRYSNLAGKV